jgi:hypothetical protein
MRHFNHPLEGGLVGKGQISDLISNVIIEKAEFVPDSNTAWCFYGVIAVGQNQILRHNTHAVLLSVLILSTCGGQHHRFHPNRNAS